MRRNIYGGGPHNNQCIGGGVFWAAQVHVNTADLEFYYAHPTLYGSYSPRTGCPGSSQLHFSPNSRSSSSSCTESRRFSSRFSCLQVRTVRSLANVRNATSCCALNVRSSSACRTEPNGKTYRNSAKNTDAHEKSREQC